MTDVYAVVKRTREGLEVELFDFDDKTRILFFITNATKFTTKIRDWVVSQTFIRTGCNIVSWRGSDKDGVIR